MEKLQLVQRLNEKLSKQSKGEIIFKVFASLFAILGLYIVLYYIWGPGVGYLHSDCTDTMYWAKASYDSGKWISDDFRYAALLPFGGNLLMLLFMPFFGFSITTHNLGMTVFTLLFGISIYLAARSFDLSRGFSLATVGTMFLVVSSSEKMLEIFWGHVIYYSLSVVLLMFGIVIINSMRKQYHKENLSIWYCIFGCLYFCLVALNGGQMLVLVSLPLLAAVVIERMLDIRTEQRKENMSALISAVVLLISVPAGLIWLKVICHGVTAGYANTYSAWVAMKDWTANLQKLPIEWFHLFGLEINARKSMFSLESVGILIRLATALIILAGPFFILFQYPKMENRNLRFMTIVHFTITGFIFVGYICGMLATANWRLSPCIVSGLFLILLYLADGLKKRSFGGRFCALACIFVILFSFTNALTIKKMDFNYNRDKAVYKVADFLEQKNLTYGFATFWNSQLITMYTGEKVKARNMIVDDNGHHFESYQSEYSWGNPQKDQDKFFLLFTKAEYSKWMDTAYGQQLSSETIEEYQNQFGYVILVFDHMV